MQDYKELRIVLDAETHNAFKQKAKSQSRSLKSVIEDLIDDYIVGRMVNIMKEDAILIDSLITQLKQAKEME